MIGKKLLTSFNLVNIEGFCSYMTNMYKYESEINFIVIQA